MAWIITSKSEPDLTWSNKEGWTDGDDYDTFTDEECNTLSLPIGGEWIWVPWGAEA